MPAGLVPLPAGRLDQSRPRIKSQARFSDSGQGWSVPEWILRDLRKSVNMFHLQEIGFIATKDPKVSQELADLQFLGGSEKMISLGCLASCPT